MAHPTTGGVLASFATLGDVLLAEPGALMSFAGPRVVQEITREKLPDDFGLAEQNLRFGHVDAIVPRPELRATLSTLLRLSMPPSEHELRLRERLGRLRNMPLLGGAKLSGELDRLQRQLDRIGAAADRRGDLALRRAGPPRGPAVHARLRRARCSTTGSSCTATAAAPTTAR